MKSKNYGRLVTPYSGIRETGVNVPSLMIMLPFSEGVGDKTTCPKTGATWDVSVNDDEPGTHLTWEDGGAAIQTTPGVSAPSPIANCPTLHLQSGKSYLTMCSARVLANTPCRCSWGDINSLIFGSTGYGYGMSDGISVSGGKFHCAVGVTGLSQRRIENDDGTCLNETQGGVDIVLVSKYIPASGSLTYAAFNHSTGASILAADTYTLTIDAVPFDLMRYFRYQGLAMYAAALFGFSAFPSWIDTAIWWMANQWRHAGLGKPRYIYPMLRGYV